MDGRRGSVNVCRKAGLQPAAVSVRGVPCVQLHVTHRGEVVTLRGEGSLAALLLSFTEIVDDPEEDAETGDGDAADAGTAAGGGGVVK